MSEVFWLLLTGTEWSTNAGTLGAALSGEGEKPPTNNRTFLSFLFEKTKMKN